MPSAGEKACWCEFLEPPEPSVLGEVSPNKATWPVWTVAWGKKRGLRGGELIVARESQAQLTEEFYFDYADVVDPMSDGKSLDERMVIRYNNELYDIDGVFPEEGKRREVRVMAIRKKQAV